MTTTLYRKYRPSRFDEMVNQQHIRVTLEHSLEQDRLAHAYLFTGPRGVGKTTVARILGRAMSCKQRRGAEPCNECVACQAMLEGHALDLVEIDAASQTGVENVRENIIHSARMAPSVGKMKVFIIDEVHMLSMSAFNALLKVLEEPPAHAVFILATTEVHRVPETVISRTQRFDFKKLTIKDMAGRLEQLAVKEKRKLAEGLAERIARAASGSMRDAESMLGQLLSFEEKTIDHDVADLVLPRTDAAVVQGILTALVHRRPAEALNLFHSFCDDGGDIATFIHELVLAARTVLLASVDPLILKEAMVDQDEAQMKATLELAKVRTTDFYVRLTEELLTAERQVNRVSFSELPVEVAFVKIAGGEGPTEQPPTAPNSRVSDAPLTAPPAKSKPGKLNLAHAQAAWTAIQPDLAAQPSLRLAAQQAQLSDWADNTLTLTVPFKLHRDRLMDPKSYTTIITLLQQHLSDSIKINIVIGGQPIEPPSRIEPRATIAPETVGGGKPKGPADLWDQVVAGFES